MRSGMRSLLTGVFLFLATGWPHTQAPNGVAPAASASTCALAQWVNNEAQIEEFLKTADIDRMEDLPIGVTKPKKGYFKAGGPVLAMAWKDLPPRMHNGYWDSYKSEIAAYELDKLLHMDMVPPAVEKRVKGNKGAAVMWVENIKAWNVNEPIKGPDPVAWEKQVIRMKMFDDLIGNADRNQGNLLYDSDYHLILIDHSRAFTNSKELPARLGRIDREYWNQLSALTQDQLDKALGAWVGKSEMKAILERRERMKDEIAKLVATRGEAAVFVK